MIRSMTGYGRVQKTYDGFNILFEVKSVNHRFFEYSARIPRVYGYLEDKIKAQLQKYITRGKVDVFLTIDAEDGTDAQVKLNYGLAESYIGALRELKQKYSLVDDISVSAVSRYTDIFRVVKPPEDEERVWNAVRAAADDALAGFAAMREAEGIRLCADITARAQAIAALVQRVEERSPETVEEYRRKLTARMEELLADVKADEGRILTEAAIFADKVSVTEETVRLRSHLKQFETMLKGDEPIGRRLDFLMQEMNREANTIGSKASDISIATMVVDIKAELEKIREQIQNLE